MAAADDDDAAAAGAGQVDGLDDLGHAARLHVELGQGGEGAGPGAVGVAGAGAEGDGGVGVAGHLGGHEGVHLFLLLSLETIYICLRACNMVVVIVHFWCSRCDPMLGKQG